MELTKREKRRQRLEGIRHQGQETQKGHEQLPEPQSQGQEKGKRPRYYAIAAVIGVVVLATAAYFVFSFNKPGQYDNFAKCLSEKGAVMYGAMEWCKYTQAQKAMFGKSFRYVNYHDFEELPGIRKTPTWVINGAWHENVQPLEKLGALAGCRL